MNRICVVTSEATWEPVSLTEIKRHLRIETTYVDEDDDLKTMISAARRLCENKLGRQLVRAQRKLILDAFPVNSTGQISIPYLASLLHGGRPHHRLHGRQFGVNVRPGYRDHGGL